MPAPALTGRFVWHELHTSDRAKAIAFYGKIAPWEIKDVPMGPGEAYGLCLLGGKDFAGITKSQTGAASSMSAPPHWLPYIAVEDVDASAKKAKELGGRVVTPPMDIPNVGRFSVIADPQGAIFALYKHASAPPAEPEKPPVGAFCWEDLWTNDAEAAAKFYAGLFGYTVEPVDMGPMGTYRLLKRGDVQTAGIAQMPPNGPPPSWLSYIHSPKVDDSTRQSVELGSKVLVPPTDIPNIGRFSVVSDPVGAAIAFFTPA
jgi:predicted enzyme related to lactoylglutathione lyase